MASCLIYSPDVAAHDTGTMWVMPDGQHLMHRVNGLELLDEAYTMEQIRPPFPVDGMWSHPENATRIEAALDGLKAFDLLSHVEMLAPQPATLEQLNRAHAPEYIKQVQQLSETGGCLAEATYVGPGSYEAALLSAGAGVTVAERIVAGEFANGLALCRPPGHHARRGQAGGFCLFNNAAVTAKHCLDALGCQRVLIIDWDLHHADGTQDIVQHDERITLCSLHQFGPELYPFSGPADDTGPLGNIVNVPLSAHISDADYLTAFEQVVPRLIEQVRPDIVLVSAGFDGHFNDINHLYLYDPGAGFNLSAQLYHQLTRIIAENTDRYLLLLEGGYNLANLSNCLANTAAAMLTLPAVVQEQIPT